jgi:hypothetical protein
MSIILNDFDITTTVKQQPTNNQTIFNKMLRYFRPSQVLQNQVRCYSSNCDKNFIIISQNLWHCFTDNEHEKAIELFTNKINDKIYTGYVPHGVLMIEYHHDDGAWWLYQSMIKQNIENKEGKK